jgi:hypothetical protein
MLMKIVAMGDGNWELGIRNWKLAGGENDVDG